MNLSKHLLIASLTLFTIISACSDGGDDSPDAKVSDSQIVGTWYSDSSNVDLSVNDTAFVDYLQATFGISQQEAQAVADSVFVDVKSNLTGTITFNDDFTYNSLFAGEGDDGSWEINDVETVVIMDKGTNFETVLEVIKLDEFTLTVRFNEEEGIDADEDNIVDFVLDIGITMYLKK